MNAPWAPETRELNARFDLYGEATDAIDNKTALVAKEFPRYFLLDRHLIGLSLEKTFFLAFNCLNSTLEKLFCLETIFDRCDFRCSVFESAYFRQVDFRHCAFRLTQFHHCIFDTCSLTFSDDLSSKVTLCRCILIGLDEATKTRLERSGWVFDRCTFLDAAQQTQPPQSNTQPPVAVVKENTPAQSEPQTGDGRFSQLER